MAWRVNGFQLYMGFKNLLPLLLIFLPIKVGAETVRMIFNSQTGKGDWITSLSTSAVSGSFILNQNTLQTGSTFYVSSGTVQGQLFVRGNLNMVQGDILSTNGTGLTLYNPTNTRTTFVNNSGPLQNLTITADDGISMSGLLSVSTVTISQIKWTSKVSNMLYPDGVTIMSVPGVNETFFGYNTNLVNSGGLFNTSFGGTAMPYPYTGNFNSCFGNSCMSGNLITTGENNNGQGYASLASIQGGSYNNCLGGGSCQLTTSGTGNTGVGGYALNQNISGDYGVGIGYRSCFWSTGTANMCMGYESGTSSDTANALGGDDHMIFYGQESGKDVARATTLTNAGSIGWRAYVHKSNSFQMGGQIGSGKEWEVLTTTLTANSLQLVNLAKYNNIATVSNGVPAEYATIDTTGLTANVGAATLYAVPATGAGMYRISSYTVETTAGSISSTLPNVQVVYTDKETGGAITMDATPVLGVAGIGQTGALTANTVGTASSGVIAISAKASTTIQYQTVNYASNLAGMTYALHIKLEVL